jgi:hypothetical protein
MPYADHRTPSPLPRVAELWLCLAAASFVASIADPVLTPMSSPSFVLTTFSMWTETRIDNPNCTPRALGCSR